MARYPDRRLHRKLAERSSCARLGERQRMRRAAAWLIAAVALGGRVAHAQGQLHALTTLPVGDPAYAQLAALDRAGCTPARISPHRPFLVRDVRRAVARFPGLRVCVGPIARSLAARFTPAPPPMPPNVAADLAAAVQESARDSLESFRVGARATLAATSLSRGEFQPLWAGVRPRDEGTPPLVGDARVRAAWTASPRWLALAEVYGLTSRRNDPTVRQRALRNTSGIVDFGETYINGSLGRLDLSFGRNWAAWLGEGTESLAFSANGPLMDRLELGLRWRVAELKAVIASVNDVTMTASLDSLVAGTPDTRFNRWLYAQVLTIKPTERLELTLGETLLSSRTTSGFDLAYANPLMAFIIAQNDTGRVGSDPRDNLVVFGAARASFGPGHVGAELVVDDIQIDEEDRENTADQLAWRLFAAFSLPVGTGSSVGAEYRRVDSYAYMRDFYTDVYQQYDKPLGSVIGPGADLIRASAETWLGGDIRFSGGIGRWRQGALRIDQRPSQGPNGNADKPFPATTDARPEVQSALIGDLRAERLSLRIPIAVRVELARIENAANVAAAAALYVRASISGSYAFRYP
jgi:hypothetical protein